MDGFGIEWIVGGIAAILVVFAIGRLSGGRADGRIDLAGPPRPVTARAAKAPPKRAGRMAGSPLLERLPPETRQAIAGALASGNKIQAIKLLREATGLGLKESKDAIEAIGG